MKKDVNILYLLKKYNLLTDEASNLIWHMNIGSYSVNKILTECGIDCKNLSQSDMTLKTYELITKKCNFASKEFDDNIYITLSRLGFVNHHIQARVGSNGKAGIYFEGMMDDYGFGQNSTQLYDDYVDGLADLEHNSKTR